MKKQLLLFILAMIPMLVSALPIVEINGISYDLDSQNHQATVTSKIPKYKGDMQIPATVIYEGIEYSVTSIGNGAFSGCTGLTSVNIPNSVTTIGNGAFSGCTGLTSITIPNSVTSIGSSAFYGCSSLTSAAIGNSVTTIGIGAFCDCTSLTSAAIGNSVTTIPSSAFQDCSSLTSITIPNSVTTIDGWAFNGCKSLTSVTIGNSVDYIGVTAFYGCSSLTSIVVEIGNNRFDSREACNAIVEKSTNTLVIGCKNSTIPNSVTSIGISAFYGCTGLTSITIPNSVTSIGNYAFSGCTGLTSITIPNNVTSIGGSAFSGCTGLTSITIPNSVKTIGIYAFRDCVNLSDFYCHAERIPTTSTDAFYKSNINNATLHVPAASIDEYKITVPWKNFKNIVPLTDTSVMPISKEQTGRATYYTLDGKQQDSLQKGLNIVRMSDGTTKKVVVK